MDGNPPTGFEAPPRIMVAASLRSGSTHIGHTLCQLTGRAMNSGMIAFGKGFGADEHSIHPFMAQALFPNEKFLFHLHLKCTTIQEQILQMFKAKVIITVRNIFDIMLSIKERQDVGCYIPGVVSPFDWDKLDDQTKWEFLGQNVVPWHLQFAASWMTAEVDCIWVRYKDYFKDQVEGATKIFEFLGMPIPPKKLIRAATKSKVNFQHGKVGRGIKAVPDNVRKDVLRLFDCWGTVAEPLRSMYL